MTCCMNRALVLSLALLSLSAFAAEPVPLQFGIAQQYGEEHAKKARAQLEPYLEKLLGAKVAVTVWGSNDLLGEALLANKVDLAWMTPLAFVLAAKKNADVVAVSKAVREGGAIYYRAALVVKAGSPLKTLADLKGKKVAWVAKSSTSGYLFARELLRKEGHDPDAFFGGESFAGDHAAACRAVREGKADVAATFASEPDGNAPVKADGCADSGKVSDFAVVASTGNLPSEVIAARPDFDRRKLLPTATAFGQMAKSDEGKKVLKESFRAQAWGLAVEGDFDAVIDLVRGASPRWKIATPDLEPRASPAKKPAATP
jgi:phosphonate transport system substrate-binding protein